MSQTMNERSHVEGRRLGRAPVKSTRKALMFSDFFKFVKLPVSQTYWRSRKPLELRDYGNRDHGCCTIAKQAVAATRMERLEQRKTIHITDAEVLRVYYAMTAELYGGGDTGAYEDDALKRWRNPDLTFRDDQGRPLTIDAFLRINPFNHDELKAALALSGAKGIAVCLNLPAAYARPEHTPPATWDVAASPVGEWMPGSWGGHSMWAHGYTREGIILDQTWMMPNNVLTWKAAATYLDEAHLVIDSVNTWRQVVKAAAGMVKMNLGDVRDAVNEASSIQIA